MERYLSYFIGGACLVWVLVGPPPWNMMVIPIIMVGFYLREEVERRKTMKKQLGKMSEGSVLSFTAQGTEELKAGIDHLKTLETEASTVALEKILKRERRLDPALTIIQILGDRKRESAIPDIHSICRHFRNEELYISSCDSLKAIGSVESSSFLCELLQSNSDRVQIAAISALGSCGTLETIEPLLKLKHSGPGPANKLVSGTIDLIRKRHNLEHGWLSIPEKSAGGLSVNEGEEDRA